MSRDRLSIGDGFRVGLGVWLAALAVAVLLGAGALAAWWYSGRWVVTHFEVTAPRANLTALALSGHAQAFW
jgi:hypothetical protein